MCFQLSAQKKTNIILILADDLGYSDLGCYGGEAKTPNLDRLAKNGIRLNQFYNNARCCPTRAALVTGLYPHQAGIGGMVGRGANLSTNAVTIAEALKTNGYATYMTGKWHLSSSRTTDKIDAWPKQRGFDKFYGNVAGTNYFNPEFLFYNNKKVDIKPEDDFYYTNAISDSTVSFLNEHFKTKKEKPFFFYVAYTAPHWPLHALEETVKDYEGVYDKGWNVLRAERLERMKTMGLISPNAKLSERDKEALVWDHVENKKMQALRMQIFAAQIDLMDQGIGKIITKLKKEGELENTLILFLSDNGGSKETYDITSSWGASLMQESIAKRKKYIKEQQLKGAEALINTEITYGQSWANLSNAPYRKFKKYGHQGGSATPFIAHWPKGIKGKNTIKNDIASIIDIMPTLIEVSKSQYPKTYNQNKIQPIEGTSLVPVFKGKKLDRDTWFMEHGTNKAYRKGDWKIVYSRDLEDKNWELYNLKNDPTELDNLAKEYPKKLQKMILSWEKWAVRVKVKRR
ncbi:arylsulfatase [Wenyingzhuangia heitensis]|uniref:Arylsulfatase n=1 Tax=Wenyingzhuangia heitensis TaxID=1487859 RepID=A0ABX0UCU5_9FLAO|nr:sulfatase-like hydrolase/transferase [Wenyingzhuangia heitensis]NIJ44882.1 arylsulfatase [Wenyingzhuangia heitensis]